MREDPTTPEDLAALVQASHPPNTLRSKLSRAANIGRYYRTSQLLQRAVRMAVPSFILRRLRASVTRPLPADEISCVRTSAPDKMRSLAATRAVRITTNLPDFCEEMSQGKFTLLQESCELGTPIDWLGHTVSHPSHLWRFQLHYQEYLLDLAIGCSGKAGKAGKDGDPWPEIWKLVADWIHQNPLEPGQLTGDAWHPYCLSRRLPVWAQLFSLSEPPEDLREIFLRSFANQAEVLSKTLEFDLGGNHLLENLRALALAGAFLEGARSERWLDLATHHLRKQLQTQVLPHGEHYERTPMYHCLVLGNLLQVAHATSEVRGDLSDLCCETAATMYGFLESILHPDGEIPLFGDSCWGEAHSVEELAALASLQGLRSKEAQAGPPAIVIGPYWVCRQDNEALIFDTGPVGADSLPAHAHCDLLGFEASIAGQRWFVDSGLFDYNESLMRDYCRSSAAHNVVTVGHQNCCDVWSRFRMGRRGRPTRFEHGQQGDFSWCQASHDGYRHLGVPEISRLMVLHPSGVWTCLDYAKKTKGTPLIGRLHLAPEIEVQQRGSLQGEPQQIRLSKEGTQRWLTATSGVELGLAEGWYCDRFGQKKRTQVITYCLKTANDMDATLGWLLSPSAESIATVTINEDLTATAKIAIDGTPDTFSKPLFN